jgi:hypothetical protein
MSENQHDLSTHHDQYGISTAQMVNRTLSCEVRRGVLLMRHSAREFRRDIHDLENPLTDHGRSLAQKLGTNLLPKIQCKAYSSPPNRCVETADFVLKGSRLQRQAQGLVLTDAFPTRSIEALGVFYALDQIRMWKGLRSAGGLSEYIQSWFDGEVPRAVMMRPAQAISMILQVMLDKLDAPQLNDLSDDEQQLDLCITHDMTVFTLRHGVGLESLFDVPVDFLDGLLLYRERGVLMLKSHYGKSVEITDHLLDMAKI